ncbi:MAG: UDP-N-acetylmuramate--L-alanine ligase [Candidatus Promineifilaceae bacterium]
MVQSVSQQPKSQLTLKPGMHIHLVGIGGSGLSAIGQVLLGKGYQVSGSDRQVNQLSAELAAAGATIYQGHAAENIKGADVVLISSAIPAKNPEIVAAHEAGIPVVKRADFLGALMSGTHGIAVAGTHGKTTTTGMVAQILVEAGLDPSVIVGGVLPALGSNGRAGQGEFFVIEADEYDYMFLGLRPRTAVVTNVEYDHPDLFPTADVYRQAFKDFISMLPSGGKLVVCSDDAGVTRVVQETDMPGVTVVTYGLGNADWQAVDLRVNQSGGTDFLVQNGSEIVGLARLRIPGEHNVRNALAAIAVSHGLGIDFAVICQVLAEFGVGRRFQVVGEVGDVTVVDDYAHHPTEIQATLAAARQRFPGRRIWAVWQPHTFSRTRLLLSKFATSFANADRVVLLDIYGSRETDNLGMDTRAVLKAIEHPAAHLAGGMEDATTYIMDRVRPSDVVLTLTAGDGNLVGQWLLERLEKRVLNGTS